MLITDAVVAFVLSCAVDTFPLTKTTNVAHELFEKKLYIMLQNLRDNF